MDQGHRQRALTLVEVLVAMSLLAGLMLAAIGIYHSGLSASRKGDAHSEAYRGAMLALERLRSELRGSQVLTPALLGQPPQPEATYRFPRVDDGIPVVDDQGVPLWANTARLRVRPDGRLVKEETGAPVRILADLGPDGSITFERRDLQVLRVTVTAARKDENVSRAYHYSVTADLELPNN